MKPRFELGQYVKATATCSMQYPDRSKEGGYQGRKARVVVRSECSFTGWIVGARRRMTGVYHAGESYQSEDGGEYFQPYLEKTKAVNVWLVARSMTNTPVEVLDGDVQPCNDKHKPAPWGIASPPEMDAEYRKMLSDIAKEQPRIKGRFVKQPPKAGYNKITPIPDRWNIYSPLPPCPMAERITVVHSEEPKRIDPDWLAKQLGAKSSTVGPKGCRRYHDQIKMNVDVRPQGTAIK